MYSLFLVEYCLLIKNATGPSRAIQVFVRAFDCRVPPNILGIFQFKVLVLTNICVIFASRIYQKLMDGDIEYNYNFGN